MSRLLCCFGLATLAVCTLKAQFNDTAHVSACVHFGDCEVTGRIAQGSIFYAPGSAVPALARTVSGFPLSANLAGVSVQVKVGDTAIDALILSIEPNPFASGGFRVRAVLPSRTPLGEASVQVKYKGEPTGGRAGLKMRVVAREFGLYSADNGFAAAQNVSSSGSVRMNAYAEPATPGQLVVLWGTGLGAATGDEAAGPLPGDLGIEKLQVLVADKAARVVYAGRSGCCAGVDQIIFEVPAGIEGCAVPVVVRFSDDGSESTYETLAIAEQAGACPMGLPPDLTQKFLSGLLTVGYVAGGPGYLSGRFRAGAYLGPSYGQPMGTCFGTFGLAGSEYGLISQGDRTLDAGGKIGLRTPQGVVTLNRSGNENSPAAGFYYSATNAPDRLLSGEYSLDNGDGGRDVGSFHAMFSMPELAFASTNLDSLAAVTASRDLTITWNAGSPDGIVHIDGAYASAPGLSLDDIVETGFSCVERADKGRLTVPGAVLWRAKGSPVPDPNTVLQLFVSNTFSSRFDGPGLDVGEFDWTVGFSKVLKIE